MDIHDSSAVANETFGELKYVEKSHSETNLVNDLVCILGVDIVLQCSGTTFLVVLWQDLYQICDSDLSKFQLI